MSWKRETRAVNSKPLLDEITSTIEDLLEGAGVIWSSDSHRDPFVEMITDYMKSFLDQQKIEQFKVICDYRNNRLSQMEKGVYHFDVEYRQRNCVNITRVLYTITDKLDLVI